MAWVRLEDVIPEHPKHLKAGPAACWLWVCAIAYCQRQLTDGFVPESALPMLGVGSMARALSIKLVNSGLFDRVDGGYLVHDYLAYNRSRSEAIQRQVEISAARAAAGRNGGRQSGANRKQIGKQNQSNHVSELLKQNEAPTRPDPIPKEEIQETRVSVSVNGTTDQALADRAGRFCERYAALYQQLRKGARYLPRPALDFTKALELCAIWPDDRLEQIATVFLKTDHEFAASGSRTIGQFAALASYCDDRLRAAELES